MWSRLRTKVLSKTPAHDLTNCTDVEFDLPGHVDDRKHVTGDVRMAVVDKCSCGSPRLATGSRRGGDGMMMSLNRKLEPPPGSKPTKNEYTRTTTDNRKKMTSSTNAGHARKEEVNNAKNAALLIRQHHQHHRLPSNAVTSSHNKPQHDNDVDSDFDTENWKSTNRKWGEEDETGSCSNYTALNYDVNYVRVSPPKMTRRLKPPPEPETKMTREAQLAASRAAGTQPLESGHDSNRKTPPVKPRITLAPRRGDPDVTKNAAEKPTPSPEVDLQEPREAGTVSKEMTMPASRESDYIALSDLQATLSQSQQLTTKPNVDRPTSRPEVASVPEVEDSKAVTAKMFNDGENSFLQFTFTVKLDNGAAKKSTTNDEVAHAPVVSGTVNIVKSTQPDAETAPTGRNDTTVTMKPVVSVVRGGVVIGRDKPETRASSAGSKLTNKPVGIAGIQLTGDDSRRHGKAESGGRPSSAGTQRSTHHQQQVCKRMLICLKQNCAKVCCFVLYLLYTCQIDGNANFRNEFCSCTKG